MPYAIVNFIRRHMVIAQFCALTFVTILIGSAVLAVAPRWFYLLLALTLLANFAFWGWIDLRLRLKPVLPAYNAEAMQEAEDLRSFVQGGLIGCLLREETRVDQGADEEGMYLPYFDILPPSGTVLRVTVTVVQPAMNVGSGSQIRTDDL